MERIPPEPPVERVAKSSYVQKLHLELVKHTQFTQLDGAVVARDLENHRHLWKAAVLTSYLGVAQGVQTEDTLLVWTEGKHQEKLVALAERWNPDALDWLSEHDLTPEADLPFFMTVLRVSWWDQATIKTLSVPIANPGNNTQPSQPTTLVLIGLGASATQTTP